MKCMSNLDDKNTNVLTVKPQGRKPPAENVQKCHGHHAKMRRILNYSRTHGSMFCLLHLRLLHLTVKFLCPSGCRCPGIHAM